MRFKDKIEILTIMVIVILLSLNTYSSQAAMYSDSSADVLHILNNTYQSIGSEHPEIDIVSLEITSSHVYLTLQSAPNTEGK